MESVLQYRPDHISNKEACNSLGIRVRRDGREIVQRKNRVGKKVGQWAGELERRAKEQVRCNWSPEQGDNVPNGTSANLSKGSQ
jgi:hypothetical protein